MEYRRLGNSGLQVSLLSFGSWITFAKQVEDGTAVECMKMAYDNGINFFDNAEIYSRGASETLMGDIIHKLGWKRDTYVVSSKVFWGGKRPNQIGLSRKHVMEACHAALKRLRVDYLDLYFCHRPDPETPIEETVRAMDTLIKQGKILYWGTSEWMGTQIMKAHYIAAKYNLTPPTMEQPQYNMFHRYRLEYDLLPLFDMGLGTTIWSPLASGILTGKYNNGIPEDSRLNLEGFAWLKKKVLKPGRIEKCIALQGVADDLGTSMAKLAVAWCAKNPNVSTVILGASKTSQLEENLKALEVVPLLTDDVMARIDGILGNKPDNIDYW